MENTAKKTKKISRSFTKSEIEMFKYLIEKISDNLKLEDEVYRDNGDILIQFDADRIKDLYSLLNKF